MENKRIIHGCDAILCQSIDEKAINRNKFENFGKFIIDIVSIFPLLQDVPKNCDTDLIKPSDFIKEMSMSTEERQQQLLKLNRNVKCPDVCSNSFEIIPDVVIFQNCTPGEYYTVRVTLINKTQISKPITVLFKESYFFTMRHSRGDVVSKIAPGIPYNFFIKFSPDESKDYQHKIIVKSDNETFNIPIYGKISNCMLFPFLFIIPYLSECHTMQLALGPRLLLDLPDEIILPSIPVKMEAERIIIVHNLSSVEAVFRMQAPPPFIISPKNCIMQCYESVRLKISYKPLKAGPIEETLKVLCDSGEAFGLKLKGYAENLNSVQLSRTLIMFEDTYMGLSRQESFEIRNTTKHILKYAWKMYSSAAEDEARWRVLRGNMEEMRRFHEGRYTFLEYHNVCSGDSHRTICERILHDEIDEYEIKEKSGDFGGQLYFGYESDGMFEILPEFGEIWPNATLTFTLIFKPKNALSYCKKVYFDLSGTETRTKLSLRGTGLGPSFELNMQILDAQNIFLCASHQFEIVVHNKGIIPGTIGFANKKWDFGAEIKFLTNEQLILPGSIGSFIFEFHSRIQGMFVEEIHFLVKESYEIIKMVMKGNVICPLLAFDVGEINFGSISLGIPYVKKFNLLNNCQVPIEFSCSIRDDGDEPPVTCEEFSIMEIKELPENPKEFNVTPLQGIVPGYSSVTITITLISNSVQQLSTLFILNMWGSNNYKTTLAVEYSSDVPNITCKTPELHVNGCFINYPYTRSVILKNQSEYSGVILVDVQKAQFTDGINYSCPITDFFIKPYGEVIVVITMITNVIGESRAKLAVKVFGSRRYFTSVVEIVCSGIGPTISFVPDVLDFENISTLTTYSAPILISNDSAITATVEIVNHGKLCKIDKMNFVIEPNQTEELIISIYLKGACKFHEKLKMKVKDGETVFYIVKAVATGTSILCTPKLEPELNLGYLYINKPFALEVTMSNESPFKHKIFWSRLKYIKSLNVKDIPVCNIPSVFSMTPVNFDLTPGSSIRVQIEGVCSKPNIVEEDFYCHAFVGKHKKTVIMNYLLKANFIMPLVKRNKQKFHFRQDLGIEVTVNFLEDAVTLFNDSKLPVVMNLTVQKPFYLKNNRNLENSCTLSLEDQEEKSVIICYDPKYTEKRCFKDNGILYIQYVDLPTTDQIPIIGEVNFPTIQLLPDIVNFGCLPIGTESYALVTMKNISPLRVNYFTKFSEKDFEIERICLQPTEIEPNLLKNAEIEDALSFSSIVTKPDSIMSISTIEEAVKCGYTGEDGWVECQKLFCSCKPNQFGNIKTALQQLLRPNKESKIKYAMQGLHGKLKPLSMLHKVFDVNPTAGFLDPYECKVLTIAFKPIPNIQVSAIMQIRIQDGETEVLPVIGKCADYSYTLDKSVEFGVKLFCEISEKSLYLKNTSYESVTYEVYHDNPDEATVNGWPQGFSIITPETGTLEPNSSINLNVKYFPGCPGEFTKDVIIKIGHFKPTRVCLHGYAVFPQIYIRGYLNFSTNRNEEDPTIGYKAIAALAFDYIRSTKDWRLSEIKLANVNISDDALVSLCTDDWELIVYNNTYPSEKDIDLAIEQYLASAITTINPLPLKDHVVKNRAMFIPRFAVQAYHLDFGLVIINSEAELPVPVECYHHFDVDLRLVSTHNLSTMADIGLTLVFKKMTLHPREIQIFHIIFKPTTAVFNEPDVEMSYVIQFSIAHGPIIPMKISAFVTTPRAHTSTTSIDFGDIQCGMAIRKSTIIENSGRVVCKWQARLLKQANRLDNIFLLRVASGVLEPGKSALIYVTFQPGWGGPVKGNLKISIDDNPDLIDIKLKGVGIESKLTIEDHLVLFNPVLPYSHQHTDITIKNKGLAPLEFVFTDYDGNFEEENIILRFLMKYYNTDTLYIPPRNPGSPLPEPLTNFYNYVQEDALEWIMDMKDDLHKEPDDIFLNKKDANSETRVPVVNKSKAAILAKLDSSTHLLDSFYQKKEEILYDYVKLMREIKSDKFHKQKVDPIAQTIAEAKGPENHKDPTDMREGVVLIFTGAPLTNAVEVANKASIVLRLPVVNLNGLIYDALIRNDSLAAIKVNEILNETFESITSTTDINTRDPYQNLIDKMDLILSGKQSKKLTKSAEKVGTKSKASSKSKSSKSSKGKVEKERTKVAKSKASTKSPKTAKNTKSKTENTNTLLNIPLELLLEIMQNCFLIYEDGVIIESLTTYFIRDPSLVLNCILKAIGNIRHIQIITLLYTWDNYLNYEEEQREKQRLKQEEELASKIVYFENMDADQFEKLTQAERVLFRKHILLKRKEVTKYRIAMFARSRASRIFVRNQKRKKMAEKKSVDTGRKSQISEKQLPSQKTKKSSSKSSKSSKKSKKSKPLSNESKSKKDKKDKSKEGSRKEEKKPLTEEEIIMKVQFDKFEQFYFNLVHLAEFWNRKICDVTRPYSARGKVRPTSKKHSRSKSSKGSAKTSAKKTLAPKVSEERMDQLLSKTDDIEIEEISIDKIQIGIPCWIFSNAHLINMVQLMADYLKHTTELQSARQHIINSKLDKPLVETTEYFSILYKPEDSTEKNISDVFLLSDAASIQETLTIDESVKVMEVSKLSLQKSKKRSSMMGKKNTKPTVEVSSVSNGEASVHAKSLSLQNPSFILDVALTPRAVIRPNENLRYRIFYHPTRVGESRHIYTIRTVLWPKKYEVACFGTADIPRILNDPNVLYSQQISKRNIFSDIKSQLFVHELEMFDFGHMLIRQANEDPKLLMKEAVFTLINHSLLPCITKIYLKDTDNDVFSLDQTELFIATNNSVSLKVYANPHLEQYFENKIYICVKDNPEVYNIDICCTGCAPQFTVNPNVLAFDRVLYQTTEKRTVKLENKSPVPLRWSFVDMQAALNFYKFSPKSGLIAGFSSHMVDFLFTGETRGEVTPIKLTIEVVDDQGKVTNPLIYEHLEVTAEVIDVTIEYESHINFGDIKGKVETIIDYHMVNHAKYDVEYIFTTLTVPDNSEHRVQKKAIAMTKMYPNKGILKPNKPFTANIHIMSYRIMDLQRMPVMSCKFMETYFNQMVAQFDLVLTGRVYLSTFELCPQSEILFGRQLVESEDIQNISIKNIGKFKFTYKIIGAKTLLETQKKLSALSNNKRKNLKKKKKDKKEGKNKKSSKSDKEKSRASKSTKASKKTKSTKKTISTKTTKSKKKSKSGKSAKSKSSKLRSDKAKKVISAIDVGIFKIIPSSGVIEPGEIISIQIISKPTDVKSFEETILFFISEPLYADRLGRPVLLKVHGQVPYLNLDNYDEIFKEHYVVDKMNDLLCPEQMACNLIFVKDEKTLFFNKICINTAKDARIKIANASMIHTEVFCKIISGSNAFKVNPNMLIIEGYNSNNFSITFKPTAIETFVATLEVSYNSMSSFQAKTLAVKLVGEGYVPEIALLCPLLTKHSNIYELHYDSVMVGDTMEKLLEIENIGPIACQVLCSINEDTNDEYIIIPPKMAEVLKYADTELLEYKDHLFDMKAGERTTLKIKYKPKTEPGTKSKLKIHIFNNPYEIFTILLNGESYNQDIKLENIEMFTHRPVKPASPTPRNRRDTPPPPPITYSKPCYELNFGHISVNRLEKKYFKITNTSNIHTYKFELDSISKLLFIPAVGHLKPKAMKEIIATFMTKSPVTFNKEILNCRFYRIEYLEDDIEPLSWDERQNFVLWMPAVCSMQSVYNSEIQDAFVQPEVSTFRTEEENTDEYITANMKMKTLEGKQEPLYEETIDTSRSLNIFFSVISDYARLHCSVSELKFEDTLLFEKRNLKFLVHNNSTIPLIMNWQIVMEEYPKRISEADNKNEYVAPINSETKRPQTCVTYQRGMKIRPRPAPLTGGEKFITNSQCGSVSRPSTARSSLFSSSSGGSSRTRDTWCDADVLPFTVHPQNFAIPPKENEIFTVTFAPNDVYQFSVKINCDVEHLAPNEKKIDINVFGRSLLPLYYFNIEPTDYLSRRKSRGKRTCDDLVDENTRIVEFEAIGIGQKMTKTFTVINPTGEEFSYRWVAHHAPQLSRFRCHTVEGMVTKGKMVEAIFTFLPQEVGIFEEYFTFHIDRYDLKALFLFVGMTREPCVFFNTRSLLMKPTVIGIDVYQYVELKNNENMELGFKFCSSSFWGDRRIQRLNVEPKSGVLKPNSETKIKIMYHPTVVEEANFYLKCEVQKRSAPCILCIITNCFSVEPSVIYLNCIGKKVIVEPMKMNTIELNDLPALHKYRIPVFIENIGQTGLYFNWSAKEKYCADSMKITFNDKEGYVKHDTIAETSFSITALKYLKKRRAHVLLEVLYGPSFPISVICSTSKITYKFSFEEYNFGPCLVQLEKSMYYKINLQFTNLESEPAVLDYSAEQLNHLTVCFKAAQVNSKATETIKIYFHPMQVKDYEDDIIFYINSKIHKIKIKGSGVPINLELDDFKDKYIDLGSPYKGTVVKRTIKVVNNGLCIMSVAINLHDRLPIAYRPPNNLSPLYEFLELSTSEISVKAVDEKVKSGKKGGKGKKKGKKLKSNSSKRSKKTKKSKSTDKSKAKGSDKKSKGSDKKSKAKGSGKKSKASTKKTKDSAKKSKASGKKSTGSKERKKKSKSKHKKRKLEKKALDITQTTLQSPQQETPEEKEKRLIQESIQITPKAFISIQPKKTAEFVIKFSPTERISSFTDKIFYQIQNHIDILCMFKGSSLGSDYYLDRDYITFTNTIKGCKSEDKLTLFNIGDIGGRFKWKYDKYDEAVSLSPMEGYISTNANVVFTIIFKPMVVHCTIRAKLKCTIDHFDQTLCLIVNGSSTDYPTVSDTLTFTCPVRESSNIPITLKNGSCEHWSIVPIVTAPVFEAPNKISLEPQSSNTFDVTYRPLYMTKDTKDIGMIIMRTPNGQATVYLLEGHALRPNIIPIEITIPCKQEYVHILPVRNWLQIPQLFKVKNEVLPVENNGLKILYKLTGNDYIEVPALGERNYNWIVHVINEGKLHFKTKIRNEASGEYIVYEIFLTITKCSSLDEIRLSTCVRQTKSYKLKFENPIGTPVDFHFDTTASSLAFSNSVTLRPYSEYFLEIRYTPLITCDSKAYSFQATTNELGTFPYIFYLTANTSIPEKLVTIQAPLGSERSQKVLLENLSETKADFITKFDDSNIFYLLSNVSVAANDKTHFEICFEPSTLGTIESKLMLTSSSAGEYIYPLKGIGTSPKPQGPFFAKSGGTINIQIKNPFFEPKSFVFETNSVNFDVKPRFETIKGKQTCKIVVNVISPKNAKQDTYTNAYPLTGKLTVTCNDAMYSDLKWVYYLQAD